MTHCGHLKNCSSQCWSLWHRFCYNFKQYVTHCVYRSGVFYVSLLRKHWRAVVNAAKVADFFSNWLCSGVMRFLQDDNFGRFTATMWEYWCKQSKIFFLWTLAPRAGSEPIISLTCRTCTQKRGCRIFFSSICLHVVHCSPLTFITTFLPSFLWSANAIYFKQGPFLNVIE